MEDRLIQLFLQIINMSITAGYVILAVLLIRLLLKKAPKKYSYALWSVVAFRLCCPVSFKSSFSLFSLQFFDMSKAQQESAAALRYIPENIGMMAQPEVTVGIPYANTIITDSLPAATPMYSANPMQIWTAIGAYLWCIGVVGLLLYSIISYLWLHHKMRNAVLLEGNVFQSDTIRSPFMLGIIRPKIYIPFGLEKQAYGYVLTHEQYHLKRKDHIIKPLAFLLLIIHWFNPLCWLAFGLMSRDMEMSCDEKVLAGEENIRKAYSAALLAFAVNKRFPSPNPLAFGETDVKKRIRNILNWKKPALWITVVAVLLCISVLIACAANPLEKKENTANTVTGTYGAIWAEKEYCVEQIIYDAPVYSFTYNIETAPGYYLTESGKLMVRGDILIADDDDWKALGTCKEFTLTEDNFDACFLDYEGNGPDWRVQNDLRKLREENELAWQLFVEEGGVQSGYYILQQNNGDVYLAYGYYDTEGNGARDRLSSVRWLFKLREADAYTKYVSINCLYMSSLSSYMSINGESGCVYYVNEDSFIVAAKSNGGVLSATTDMDWEWQPFPYTREEWEQMVFPSQGSLDIYKEKLYLELSGAYSLLKMDGELWIMRKGQHPNNQEFVWEIYSLEQAEQ